MAYSEKFLRLVLGGNLYAVDQWTLSMSLRAQFGSTPTAPESVPQGVIDAAANWFASPTMISHQARLNFLKLNEIGTDGKYTHSDTVVYDFEGEIPGASSNNFPPQIAYCVSLRTDFARGRAHAGRFYIPMPSTNPDATGKLSDFEVGKFANPTETFLRAIQTSLPGYELAIMSNIGAGTAHTVTHAAYGRVLDTIRSRRNKFTENYVEGQPL